MRTQDFYPRAEAHFNRRAAQPGQWENPIARVRGVVQLPGGKIAVAAAIAHRPESEADPLHPNVELLTTPTGQMNIWWKKWDSLKHRTAGMLYVPGTELLVLHEAIIST